MNAVICSDLGVVQLVKENSKIPVHLSTQAFVLNSYHARIWKNLGVKRIVLGRELSIKQAAKIKQETGIEVGILKNLSQKIIKRIVKVKPIDQPSRTSSK